MIIRNTGFSNSHHSSSQYVLSWRTKIQTLCHKHNMAILMILLWHCANSLTYYLLLEPSYLVQNLNTYYIMGAICYEAILALFSLLAGLLADVVYGRFKVLKCSTYILLASEILTLVVSIMMYAVVDTFNYIYYLLIVLLVIALSGYYLGRVFFLTNVVQFGTDQIRDSPTQNSVLYIHIFFWSSNLSNLLSMTFSSIPHHEITLPVTYHNNTINNIDPTALYLFQVSLSMSAIFSIIILFIVQKHSDYFLTEYIMGNPYKLVYGVVRFAIKHKHPIKRSAFTYCNDERPSRLDYGKQSYGGPFTTEQVEDVKSLLHIAKVLISLGPAFLLDLTGLTIFRHHRYHQKHFSKNPYNIIFLQNGILSPLLIAVCIPCYLVLIKPFFSRYIPNMFKRMGLNIIMLNILFLLYIIVCSIDKYHIEPAPLQHLYCSDTMPLTLVDLTDVCMVFQLILSSLHQMLLYIAAWEFICCQSPQHMKGLLFGLFYSIKAFFQLLAAFLSYLFFVFSCQLLGYFLFILAIGLVSLVIFTVVARRYKYRKRDDICNIYQYAEDYYSNIK